MNCNIIKDLLPSYIDNICSDETKLLVDEHLSHCENCKDILDNMKEEINVSSIDEKKAIKKFFVKIKKKRFIAIALSILITLFLVIISWVIFNKKDFVLGYYDNLITVEETEQGEIIANVNTINYTTCQLILEENYDGSVDVYITLFQSLTDKIHPSEEFKSVGSIQKCWNNYIDENVDFNWLWENNKGKIVLKTRNNVKIANIYYLETMEKYKTISLSHETVDPAFEMIKIWSPK